MRAGVLIVLAITAVLCGAPPPASAAGTVRAPHPSGASTAAPSADAASAQADPTVGPIAIALGIGGIAAMAFVAWLIPLVRRRRRVEPRWTDIDDDVPSGRTTAEQQVTAALQRRTLRRARVRLGEDPIVASMGVGSPPGAETPARRTRRSRRSPPT